jgi:hypothetical protein
MEMNMEKIKAMRIIKKPSSVQIVIDQTQLEKVEYFNYLGSIITHNARRRPTHKIKSRIAMAKIAFNRKQNFSTSKLDLNLRKELLELLDLQQEIVQCQNLDTSGSRSEIPRKVLKCGAGEGCSRSVRNDEVLQGHRGDKYHTYKRKKAG